jgi:hypothetical protein
MTDADLYHIGMAVRFDVAAAMVNASKKSALTLDSAARVQFAEHLRDTADEVERGCFTRAV